MVKRGKRYESAVVGIDPESTYAPREAVSLAKKSATARFDETVELHLKTGADPRHAEQMVRGIALLPHGVGKEIRTLVFCQGDAIESAKQAGADAVKFQMWRANDLYSNKHPNWKFIRKYNFGVSDAR